MRQRSAGTVARSTSLVPLFAISALAFSAGPFGSIQPAGAGTAPFRIIAPTGIKCEHVTGTTGGVVTLSSCRSSSPDAGTGTVPGKMFSSGKRTTEVIRWTSEGRNYSTTVSTTTSPDSSGEYCARHGYRGEYVVRGMVTANTDPDIAVGQSVSGGVCISSAGAVRQTHYGSLGL